MLTQTRIQEMLDYDPETGVFAWRQRPCPRVHMGDPVGYVLNGYLRLSLDGVKRSGHQFAWVHQYGEWPQLPLMIDHINGDKLDNRIANLRLVTASQNAQNIHRPRLGRSGTVGVAWKEREQKWCARITIGRKEHFLGYFDEVAAARAVYLAAREQLHTHAPAA